MGETRGCGVVLTVGQGDTGQLGLGEDIMERSRPALVKEVDKAVEVVAGKQRFKRGSNNYYYSLHWIN